MAMIVQHNITAMNSSRMLGVTTNAQAKTAEKLSSGYRINRAGDDAAGLKISEKMRSQIRGLQKASTNAQDGVSLIQTAEGALNEAHSILQRMNELAVQGANDTNEGIDRDAINQELAQLTTELDRIASTTQFNKQNLLDGTFEEKNLQVGANTNQKISVTITAMNATAIGLNDSQTVDQKVYTLSGDNYFTKASAAAAIASKVKSIGSVMKDDTTNKKFTVNGQEYTYSAGDKTSVQATATAAAKSVMAQSVKDYEDKITKSTTTSTVTVPTVSSYEKAQATLSKIQNAINEVSEQRSALGAIQNRLEHTIANLDNVAENTQAAESRIRDTDMANEMVEYSKNQILAQAGQAMLAQANQSTQGVLSLLQ